MTLIIPISLLPPGTPKATDLYPADDVTDLTDPTSTLTGTTKSYSLAELSTFLISQFGYFYVAPCQVATTADIGGLYVNGVAGAGATLTNNGTQVALTIDGRAMLVGDRILVKNQSSSAQNGIYSVMSVGSATTNWVIVRTTDFDTSSKIFSNEIIYVIGGTVNASTIWISNVFTPVVVGTTAINFNLFSIPVLPLPLVPYAVVTGGTTPSGTLQQVAGLGSVGQVLTSQGAGTLPIWAPVGIPTGAPLTEVSDTNVTLTLTGAPTTALVTAAGITVGWTGTLAVTRGGTGLASATAYSVLCGGTTSTGAFQSVASLGSAGQVLTSNGAAALPTWQAGGSGSGTVSSGLINQLGWYAAAGTTISGLTTTADRVMVSVGGVPTWTLSLPTGTTIGGYLPLAGGTMSGAINMGGIGINNMLDPVLAQDAATKHYVDVTASGLSVQPAAQAATTVNLNATQAGAGVGATLTNAGTQVAFAVDGYSASVNDAILVKNQTLTQYNGIYIVTTLGSGVANWVLTRATYYDTNLQIEPGNLVAVNQGTVNGGSAWLQTATVATVDTDPILFSPFGVITAGTGLTKTGTVISLLNPVALNLGGTNAALSAVNGGIVYGTATAMGFSAAGSANQLLISGGAGAPTWLANAASSVMVTSAGSIPSFSTTLPAGLTIPGYAHSGANSDITSMTGLTGYLQAPLGIKDANGNIVLNISNVALAVNFIQIANAAAGSSPSITATGADAVMNLNLISKSGGFRFKDSRNVAGAFLSLVNAAGTFATTIGVAAAQATSVNFNLPALDGVPNGPMITDGSGNLSFGGTFTDISASITVTGFSAISVKQIRQCNIGKIVHITLVINGTSNATGFTLTGFPNASNIQWICPALITNNSANNIGLVSMTALGTTLTVFANSSSNLFVASGAKNVFVNFFYEST
jgi:hypothetical protein